jgi:hypothetical protein
MLRWGDWQSHSVLETSWIRISSSESSYAYWNVGEFPHFFQKTQRQYLKTRQDRLTLVPFHNIIHNSTAGRSVVERNHYVTQDQPVSFSCCI